MATIGCGTSRPDADEVASAASISDGQIGRGEVLERARSWIDERVPYSQSAWHSNRYGSYRQDCSGYVSMAWHLDQSRTTWTLWDVSHEVPASDLQPGDALLRDSNGVDHVALFVRWADGGRPVVWEEYDYGQVAEERVWEGLRGFTPVRYHEIVDDGTTCPGGGGRTIGMIDAKYRALGGCNSFLGAPLQDEMRTPDGQGRFSVFEWGSIYWTEALGAHEVHGGIRDKWKEHGWEAGKLGYPITDEMTTPDQIGRYSVFQWGSIYWSEATGSHEVHGAIRDKWKELGWEAGSLGYPVSDEYAVTQGRKGDFQHGSLTWNEKTNGVTVDMK